MSTSVAAEQHDRPQNVVDDGQVRPPVRHRQKLTEVRGPLPTARRRFKVLNKSYATMKRRMLGTAMLTNCEYLVVIVDEGGAMRGYASPDLVPFFTRQWGDLQNMVPACLVQSRQQRRRALAPGVGSCLNAKLADLAPDLLAKACVWMLDAVVPKRAYQFPWSRTTVEDFKQKHPWYPLDTYGNFQQSTQADKERFVRAVLVSFPTRVDELARAAARAEQGDISLQETIQSAVLNCSKELNLAPYGLQGVLCIVSPHVVVACMYHYTGSRWYTYGYHLLCM